MSLVVLFDVSKFWNAQERPWPWGWVAGVRHFKRGRLVFLERSPMKNSLCERRFFLDKTGRAGVFSCTFVIPRSQTFFQRWLDIAWFLKIWWRRPEGEGIPMMICCILTQELPHPPALKFWGLNDTLSVSMRSSFRPNGARTFNLNRNSFQVLWESRIPLAA